MDSLVLATQLEGRNSVTYSVKLPSQSMDMDLNEHDDDVENNLDELDPNLPEVNLFDCAFR